MSDNDELRDALASSLGSGYAIERELDAHGMSYAFVARDVERGRDVVVKVLSRELSAGMSLERFAREINVAAALRDPHIASVQSAGVTVVGRPYYIMPFIRGESLRARMSRDRIPVPECVGILRDIARALAHAHRQGVIHRNLTPEHVLLSFGTAVVTEFGIARAIAAARARVSGGDALTRAGVSIGSPAYMAPEQAAGERVDARSDLYAWGMIAYEMLTGAHAFPSATSKEQLIAAQVGENPVHLILRLPEVPPALSELVMRCLEKDPARRPVAAAELVRLLDDATQMAPPRVQDAAPSVGINVRQFVVGAIATVVVGALAFGTPEIVSQVRRLAGKSPESMYVTAEVPMTTVVVLPIASVGSDPKQQALVDALSAEVTHALSALPDVRVIGRTSALTYKDSSASSLELGKVLNVGGIVTASVQRVVGKFVVSLVVVNGNDGRIVWQNKFEEPVTNVFGLQDKLTAQVASAISSDLSRSTAASAARVARGTTDTAAYSLFMQGVVLADRGGESNLRQAISLFTQSASRDPRFARAVAHAALAYEALPSDSAVRSALTLADRALALDTASGEAQLARGIALAQLQRFAEAEVHFARAVSALPGDASIRQRRAENLQQLGRMNESLTDARLAASLDPLSPMTHFPLLRAHFAARRFSDALAEAQRMLDMDSTLVAARVAMGNVLTMSGRIDSAVKVLDDLARRAPATPGVRASQMLAYAAAGRMPAAFRMRELILGARPRSDYEMVMTGVVFGEPDVAMRVLESSDERVSDLFTGTWSLGCDPLLDPLKTDPRFIALAQRRQVTVCPITSVWPILSRTRRNP